MIKFKGLVFSRDFESKSKKNLSQAQDYVDKECLKYLPDYTPIANKKYKNAGKMSKAHKIQQPGLIINTEPKARHEYYVNKGFSGPNRGKYWLERMKADHKDDILKGLKKHS